MRVRIVIEDNVLSERMSFQKYLLIGRDDSCDLRIPETNVSRRHCMLLVDGDRVLAIDLASSNGTEVNGSQIEPGQGVFLSHNDQIVVGGIAMRIAIHDQNGKYRQTRSTKR